MAPTRTVARGLGAFSLALGVVQLVAPRRLLAVSGIRPRDPAPGVTRLVGARELVAAAGLLGQRRPVPFAWFRVAGDAMDLALVGRAVTGRRPSNAGRTVATLGALAAITAVDLVTSVALAQERQREEGTTSGRRPVRRAITIGQPRENVYAFWRDFTNLPKFMRHLQSVEELGGGRSRWTAKAPVVGEVSWEAAITAEEPGRRIAWRSLPASAVRHEGSVTFVDAPGDRGTEVHVELEYEPPAGPFGVAVAKIQGEEPAQQVGDDLRRLKQVLETGEVLVSDAVMNGHRIRQRPAQPSADPVLVEA